MRLSRRAVSMYEVEVRTLVEQPTAVVRAKLKLGDIPQWMGHVYDVVAAHVMHAGIVEEAQPIARYRPINGVFEVEAGFTLPEAVGAADEVEPATLPGGPAAVVVHIGPYDRIAPAYEALAEWLRAKGLEAVGRPWEVYFSPPEADPATWRTEVVQPYRVKP
jgi:effector-binding domain-containing protein